jgi:predicted small lipoprotein YifL
MPQAITRVRYLPLLLALLTLAACGSKGPGGPSPNGTGAQVGQAPTTAAATPPPTVAATPNTEEFPKTARAYAESVLAAWKQHQLEWLGDLTTPEVQEQIIEIPGPPNQSWTYHRCDNTAGSAYCEFFNADGDAIVLRISTPLLGKAHATIEVSLDQTEYSMNAVTYVKAFLDAWKAGNLPRMRTLANQNEVDYFTHYTPPDAYSTCTDGAAGSTYVRVYNSDGLNYTLRVVNQELGKKHAIAEHSNVPAPCP